MVNHLYTNNHEIVYWNKDTQLIQSYSRCPIRWEQTLVPPFRGCIHIRLDSPSLQVIHPELVLIGLLLFEHQMHYPYLQTIYYILPVTTPTKATYYTCKLSSHITRFTLFILDYQHVSQVFMHNYYHNYCHRTTNHYRYIAPQGRSHSKNLVT